jgi:hypothetical protein
MTVIDRLEMIEIHQGDAAGLTPPSGKLPHFAELGQHSEAAFRTRERVAMEQRFLELALQRLDLEPQPVERIGEIVVVLRNDLKFIGGCLSRRAAS